MRKKYSGAVGERFGPTPPREVLPAESNAPGAPLDCALPPGQQLAAGAGTAGVRPQPLALPARALTDAHGGALPVGEFKFSELAPDGTAVALAANFGTVGLGTDTGGSVRAPASITNLVGIRPTVGLVSRTGMGPLDSQRDTPGPMGRSVEDVARLLDVMAGVDPADERTAAAADQIPPTYTAFLDPDGLRGTRIGVLRQALALQDGADPRVVALFDAAVGSLRGAGAVVVDDFRVPGFEDLPRPPQTVARTKADWEAFLHGKHQGVDLGMLHRGAERVAVALLILAPLDRLGILLWCMCDGRDLSDARCMQRMDALAMGRIA